MFDVPRVEDAIESFIRYLAVERGLSDNYQLSTQRSLNDFASWFAEKNRGQRSACEDGVARGHTPDDQRISGGEKEVGAFGGIDQADRGRAQDFLSVSRRQRRDRARSDRSAQFTANRALFAGNVKRNAGRTAAERHRHQGATRFARPGNDRIALCQRPPHFRTGRCAPGEFLSGGRNDPCARERKQNTNRSGRAQSVRSARLLFVHRAAEIDQAPERERDFPVRTRNEINDRADLADREGKSPARWVGKEYLSTLAPAQLRDAFAEQRRRPAHHSRDARPRRYFDDAGLYARRSAALESGASTISSPGVIETDVDR